VSRGYYPAMIWQTLGGIGLFLLGMMLMTDGLKALAGPALRTILSRFVSSPVAGVGWGAGVTALVQSSSATTVTTIGFVSAGLLSFPQAIGVIFGANLGTTSTSWIVSLLGLKLSIGAVAQPVIFLGVLMRLLARDRIAALGLTLAGFGLLFVGLDVLQAGMAGLSEHVTPDSFPSTSLLGVFMLLGIGIAMTVVVQSSSAAIATTLTALYTGNISIDQAAFLVIGQSIGTCVTAVIAAMGASRAGKRTAAAHVLFNVLAAAIALPLVPLFVRAAGWAMERHGLSDTVAIASFHTGFKLAGVLVLLPLIGPFSRMVERIIPLREPSLVDNLDPNIASVPAVALDALRSTLARTAQALSRAIRARLVEDRRVSPALLTDAKIALERAVEILGSLSTQPTVRADWANQNAMLHAIDHLSSLLNAAGDQVGLKIMSSDEESRAIAERIQTILRAIEADPLGTDTAELGTLSREIAAMRTTSRANTLEQTAKGEFDPVAAARRIDAIRWCDRVGYHLWRAAAHLSSTAQNGESHEPSDSEG